MKSWLRPLFFGGGWSFGLLAIGLLVALPEAAYAKDREALVLGFGSAVLSGLAFWIATRMPRTSSLPMSISGWIVGFFLLPSFVRGLVGIADLLFHV